MITPVDFSFVSAKLHGMRSKLYEGARLDALTTLRNPFEMMSAVFPATDLRDRYGFEQRLVEQHVHDLNRICVLLEGANRAFFDWQIERYRIENVKTLLRAWKARELVVDARSMIARLPDALALDVDGLLSAPGLADFTRLLPGRLYTEGVRRGAVQYHDTNHLFFIEAGLDAVYFEELCRRAAALSKADRAEVETLVGLEVRIYDVLFALRGRLNLGLSAEAVGDFLVTDVGAAPDSVSLEPVLAAEDFAGMLAALPQRRMLPSGEPQDIAAVQRALHEHLGRAANRAFYRSMFGMGVVEGFYYVKRVELANLIRACELLRQERPGADIARELLRVGGS